MPSITFSGLASGLDTNAMVEAILNVERQPLERLLQRQGLFNQKKSAFDELQSKLNSFESSLRDLKSSRTFRGRSGTVSDDTVLRATPGSGAETGLFTIDVTALASAHKLKSEGFAGSDQGLVADGTITIQSGSNDLITVDVSALDGNNTLEAIRSEINAADAGVQAAIIFDGTDYRLTVRAEETGTANSLTVTDSTDLDLDVGGNVVNTATDAAVSIDGIDITSSSNKLTGVIPGVTLDLLSTTTVGSPITVEVAQDNDAVVEAVGDLVSKYNELTDFFNQQFDYEAGGPLAGDSTARGIQSKIQNLFTGGVDGIPFGNIRSLSAIGVSFDGKTGNASLDSAKLRELLDTNFDEVGNLFLSSGTATDPRIQFLSSNSATQAGTYAVEVTQAAEQASVIANKAISNTINQDENLTITVGSESTVVALTSGQDIDEVVDTVNQSLRDNEILATAINDGGKLRISTQAYGSNADISVVSDRNVNNGKSSGFTTTATVDTGLDVEGKIGGVDAIGAGQVLSADESGDFAGLKLKVTANAAAVAAVGGDFGSVDFSRGLVDSLFSQVDRITKFGSGEIDVTREGFDSSIKSLTKDIERLEDRLAARETQLILAFGKAEQAISALNAQQASLGGFRVL